LGRNISKPARSIDDPARECRLRLASKVLYTTRIGSRGARSSVATAAGGPMAGGILVTVKTNNPVAYLIGIIAFLIGGIVLAILAFSSVIPGGAGSGVFGILIAVASVVLLIEYIATR
jgi:hypothetical protein